MIDNRQLAVVILLGVFGLVGAWNAPRSMAGVVVNLLHPGVSVPIAIICAYAMGMVLAGARVGLWVPVNRPGFHAGSGV